VDLVVSGINRGANVGINVLYSGTVSAATEGAIMGVPSLAVSLDTHRDADFSVAAAFARKMASFITAHPPAHNVAINVNVPALPEAQIKGIAVTKQGRTQATECFEKRTDPRENTYYWLAGEMRDPACEEVDSDVSALARGMISVTPIYYDLTRHDLLADLSRKIKKNLR
jgi:5'-nucleotidase